MAQVRSSERWTPRNLKSVTVSTSASLMRRQQFQPRFPPLLVLPGNTEAFPTQMNKGYAPWPHQTPPTPEFLLSQLPKQRTKTNTASSSQSILFRSYCCFPQQCWSRSRAPSRIMSTGAPGRPGFLGYCSVHKHKQQTESVP